jgi:hypothetical protein
MVEGTDLSGFGEFQERILKECVTNVRPIEMIDDLCNLLDWNDICDEGLVKKMIFLNDHLGCQKN